MSDENIWSGEMNFINMETEFSGLTKIYNRVSFLEVDYPHFKEWLFFKVFPDVLLGRRSIITKFNTRNDLVSLLILKHDGIQKKICTLWVDSSQQRKGIGSELIERSIIKLETESPLITVSETRMSQFESLLDKYNFEYFSENDSYYKKHLSEFSFNGEIETINPKYLTRNLSLNMESLTTIL